MSQFDAPAPLDRTPAFAQRVNALEFDARVAQTTRRALQDLVQTLQQQPALYTQIQAKREWERAEAAPVHFAWSWLSQTFSHVSGFAGIATGIAPAPVSSLLQCLAPRPGREREGPFLSGLPLGGRGRGAGSPTSLSFGWPWGWVFVRRPTPRLPAPRLTASSATSSPATSMPTVGPLDSCHCQSVAFNVGGVFSDASALR
jgi:hypothetical protein